VRRTAALAIFISFLTTVQVYGQNAAAMACPTISVTGPAGIVDFGEIATFSAEVSGSLSNDLKFEWTVSQGTIVSGENSLLLKVRIPDNDGRIVATFTIKGLPQNCPNTLSETYSVPVEPRVNLLDEYGVISLKEEKIRLKRAATELKKNPYSQLYLIIYKHGSKRKVEQRITRLRDYMKVLGLENNLSIVVGPEDGVGKSRLYLVPPGVDNPQP
jgi:hypothetical protein